MPHDLIASPVPGFLSLIEAATCFLKDGKCLWVNFVEYIALNIFDFGFDLGNGFQLFGCGLRLAATRANSSLSCARCC